MKKEKTNDIVSNRELTSIIDAFNQGVEAGIKIAKENCIRMTEDSKKKSK